MRTQVSASSPARTLGEYWNRYAAGLVVHGAEGGSREFFRKIKEEHDRAYSGSNEILDIPGQKGKSILEIMCGVGIDAVTLAAIGARVTFMSPSRNCVELTRTYLNQEGLKARLLIGDPDRLSFGANTFDIVIARGVLMFSKEPELVIAEAHRVLKPGGVMHAHFHNRYSWYILLAKLSKRNLISDVEDPPVSRLCSVKEGRQLFRGFSSLRVYLDRFPTRTCRSGPWATVFNTVLVPIAERIPRIMMRPFGYYIVVRAIK